MRAFSRQIIFFVFSLLLFVNAASAASGKTVQFTSGDGLLLTADLYVANPSESPFILLFHQAGWSRGEYIEIAPRLNALGFNCLAPDQRSGGKINGVVNKSHAAALTAGKGTSYLDAVQDMQAAIAYIQKHFPKAQIILWGSSYSAALVLRLAGMYGKQITAVLSFSPGEYFKKLGQSGHYIQDGAKKIHCPVFITSKRAEAPGWENIWNAIPSKQKIRYIPKSAGHHGSRALWAKFPDSKDYWKAVEQFLITISR